jgi:hypothetical protein
MLRTDIHKPSSIEPEDYAYIGVEYGAYNEGGDRIEYSDFGFDSKYKRSINEKMADHQHGGSCQVCGAHALYTAIFYHEKSDEYIRTGFDCATKLEIGDPTKFRSFKKSVKGYLEAVAGKRKAKALLEELSLGKAYELFEVPASGNEENKIYSVVSSIVRQGDITEKQESFLKILLERIENRAQLLKERAEEKASAQEVPEGKQLISGEILKAEWRDSQYGASLKITTKDDRGFVVWGTCPKVYDGDLQYEPRRGDKISFTANVKQSDSDSKFGFYSRPTKSNLLEIAEKNK